MFVFRKIWLALPSWNTRSEIQPFVLLPTVLKWLLLTLQKCRLRYTEGCTVLFFLQYEAKWDTLKFFHFGYKFGQSRQETDKKKEKNNNKKTHNDFKLL